MLPPGDGLPAAGEGLLPPGIERADEVAPKDARDLTKVLLARLAELEEGCAEYLYTRRTLIEMNVSLVQYVAGRYRNRGNGQVEDIVQVGTVGLIKAIDRFDTGRGVEFVSFAVPYILGEIKRHFRDTSWSVHVPRRLQELRIQLARAQERLVAELGREPTVRELAAALDVTEEQVIEGIVAANGYTAGSLDTTQDERDAGGRGRQNRPLAEVTGEVDPCFETFENLHSLAPLLAGLGDRERHIIELRFGQEMTQAEIGEVLGISQMHVSRLLSQTLGRLRRGLLSEE
ncbi:SigB/SigF/SigG family RNA polymerase sigma factor [Streptomyces indicus]|uniref:SigB/SigF/SigG family RNA polymerase sigma factor n=1 Tax=Streptomyces indicus TaxID=417292 RepID=UPI003CCBA284